MIFERERIKKVKKSQVKGSSIYYFNAKKIFISVCPFMPDFQKVSHVVELLFRRRVQKKTEEYGFHA